MKLPQQIRRSLLAANTYVQNASKMMNRVESYLEELGFREEDLRCGNGVSLEEFEYGNGDVDAFEVFLDTLIPAEEGEIRKEKNGTLP